MQLFSVSEGDNSLTLAMQAASDNIQKVLLGKSDTVHMALTCLLSGGHLLLEDVPGVGKTILAQALAKSLGLEFARVQFTSDLLPTDILGVSIYDKQLESFRFQPGPIFSQVILADEINRATPKTQSALLEAMEEGQVSLDGETRQLPQPFFVIATQNPIHQSGTFPLPESQLDRFLMRVHIGYPDHVTEKSLFTGADPRLQLQSLGAAIKTEDLVLAQQMVTKVTVTDALADYVAQIVEYTRSKNEFALGLSPRAGISIVRAGRSYAWLAGRDYVIPEDIQTVFPAVAGHRLRLSSSGHLLSHSEAKYLVLDQVPVP